MPQTCIASPWKIKDFLITNFHLIFQYQGKFFIAVEMWKHFILFSNLNSWIHVEAQRVAWEEWEKSFKFEE